MHHLEQANAEQEKKWNSATHGSKGKWTQKLLLKQHNDAQAIKFCLIIQISKSP